MNLIQKAIKTAKEFIDEKILSSKFDLFVKAKKIEAERNIIEIEEDIQKSLKEGHFIAAFNWFESLQLTKKNIEHLDEFVKYVKEDCKE